MDELRHAYEMGLDCGTNGPNIVNCNFRIFATPEQTKEWERGKKDAENRRRPNEQRD